MAFLNNDVYGNYEVKKAISIMKEFGQLSVEQLMAVTELNENEAIMVMHRALHQHLVREVTKNKYILNCDNGKSYDSKMEKAMDLAISLCNGNEQFDFSDCIRNTQEPFLIYMCTMEDDYNITYIDEGKERMLSSKITHLGSSSKVIALIEHKGQLENLKIENLCAVYLVTNEGFEYVQ